MSEKVRIEVENPKKLAGAEIAGERISVGEPGDYKPSLAKMGDGELLITTFGSEGTDEGKLKEETHLFRSSDGGKSWGPAENLATRHNMAGREPYLSITKDGIILITVHFLSNDVRNTAGRGRAFVYRSEDAGKTWSTTAAEPESIGAESVPCTSRNILELQDGSLILGVGIGKPQESYLWRSNDKGRTWGQKERLEIIGMDVDYPTPFLGEGVWWQGRSGEVFLVQRITPGGVGELVPLPAESTGNDQSQCMVLYRLAENGRKLEPVRRLGGYGQMYPAILRLKDGRLLFTFTVRALHEQLGVRAVLGEETEHGPSFDVDHDRFMLDTKTPRGLTSGGGFGPTVQLDDGMLVTSYSWRDAEEMIHSEVLRWRLPEK